MAARFKNMSINDKQARSSGITSENQNTSSHTRVGNVATNSQDQARRRRTGLSRQSHTPSEFSSPAIINSGFANMNFMLGAGMVVFQPSTDKVVIVTDTQRKDWFLPRGRKDVGEELGQTALREAYEEVLHTLFQYDDGS
jgi:hypothetical protein